MSLLYLRSGRLHEVNGPPAMDLRIHNQDGCGDQGDVSWPHYLGCIAQDDHRPSGPVGAPICPHSEPGSTLRLFLQFKVAGNGVS